MAHELLQLVPQLAGLPGGAAKTLQGSLLGGLRSEARVAFQDFEASVGRDPSRTPGELSGQTRDAEAVWHTRPARLLEVSHFLQQQGRNAANSTLGKVKLPGSVMGLCTLVVQWV